MTRRVLGSLFAVVLAIGLVAGAATSGVARTRAGGGPSETDGFDGTTIKLGVLTPLTGRVSLIGIPLTAGNQMYWDYVNGEKGGVAGKYKVELVEEDSEYAPPTAIQAYDKIKGDVVTFQQILGSQVTQAVLPKMEADKTSAVPATLDATWVHQPNLFPIGAPYQVEAINALDYYVNNGGKGTKVCALAQDDEFGEAGLEGLASAKKSLKLKTGPTVRFATGDDLTAQVQELSDAKCEAVLVVATAADATSIITKAIQLNFTPRMITLAPFWLPLLASSEDTKQYLVDHVWVAAEQAIAWGDTSIPGMQEFLTRQQKYAPNQKPDPYFVFGYLQGMAMDQILARAVKNGDLSKEGILEASNQIGTLKFGGLAGDYKYGKSAEDRNPPRTSAVFQVDPNQPVGLSLLNTGASKAAKQYQPPED